MIDGKNLLSKRCEHFTLRILEGHRTINDNGRIEKAIRLEISDEYRNQQCCNNNTEKKIFKNKDLNEWSDRRKPFSPLRQINGNVPFMNNLSSCKNRTVGDDEHCIDGSSNQVQLYELEVGESDFAALQQDQALLVDFANFSNSFIHLLCQCDLGMEDVGVANSNDGKKNLNGGEQEILSNTHTQIQGNNPLMGCQLSSSSGMVMGRRNRFLSPNQDANKFIGQTMGCDTTYTCRIEEYLNKKSHVNSWNNTTNQSGSNVRFSIVESNQFRELTHLSLNLSVGSDAAIKSYLSIRLHETIGSVTMLKHKLNSESFRAENAEQACNEMEKKFHDLMNANQVEKNALVNEADETIQKQNSKMLEDMKLLQDSSTREIESIRNSSETMQKKLKSDLAELQLYNEEVETERAKLHEKNMKLTNCLQEQETISEQLSMEKKELSDELLEEKAERKKVESQLQQIQEKLFLVEQSNEEKKELLNQMEGTIKTSSKEAQEANVKSESNALRIQASEQELGAIKEELNRTKDLLSRYQSDRQEMKRRMKSKVDLIQKQEEILASNEMNFTGTQERMELSERELSSAKHEINALREQLDEANKTVQENQKTLQNNQQVRSTVVTSM